MSRRLAAPAAALAPGRPSGRIVGPMDHQTFAGAYVDRAGERRLDAEWQRRALASPRTRFVAVWRRMSLAAGERVRVLDAHELGRRPAPGEAIFLGLFHDAPAFAIELDGGREPDGVAPFAALGEFRDLRHLGGVLPADEANLVAHALAMTQWHAMQRHCGRCGAPTAMEHAGNTRVCTAPECGERSFPRVDPAIIVLVERGERCLLGRQASWPAGRYSTIAGFVEPGESLEDAVRREVFEETNVRVGEVRYRSSQPWPFPSSLMLGFRATAAGGDIVLNDGELEDARWFTREELAGPGSHLPARLSIARGLVDEWLAEDVGSGPEKNALRRADEDPQEQRETLQGATGPRAGSGAS